MPACSTHSINMIMMIMKKKNKNTRTRTRRKKGGGRIRKIRNYRGSRERL